ncbi:MAG: hypothetical protein CL908_12535 [Deltaproteobacteria bacterium]|nr:hypothetical protein [Deltaproteobacteria bacterium]
MIRRVESHLLGKRRAPQEHAEFASKLVDLVAAMAAESDSDSKTESKRSQRRIRSWAGSASGRSSFSGATDAESSCSRTGVSGLVSIHWVRTISREAPTRAACPRRIR